MMVSLVTLMTEGITEAKTIEANVARHIRDSITQRYFDTWRDLLKENSPTNNLVGLSLATTGMLLQIHEVNSTIDSGEYAKILDDLIEVIQKYAKKGIDYPSQAAALSNLSTVVLGFPFGDLGEENE